MGKLWLVLNSFKTWHIFYLWIFATPSFRLYSALKRTKQLSPLSYLSRLNPGKQSEQCYAGCYSNATAYSVWRKAHSCINAVFLPPHPTPPPLAQQEILDIEVFTDIANILKTHWETDIYIPPAIKLFKQKELLPLIHDNLLLCLYLYQTTQRHL